MDKDLKDIIFHLVEGADHSFEEAKVLLEEAKGTINAGLSALSKIKAYINEFERQQKHN